MKELAAYSVASEGVRADVAILEKQGELVTLYELRHAKVKQGTEVALTYLKEKIIESIQLKISELLDPREAEKVKQKIIAKSHELVKKELGGLNEQEEKILVGILVQQMVGLGDLELLLADESLEEIVVSSAKEPVWVYHKKFGWLKTNVKLQSEEQIHNYASIIGRKIGKQITNLDPLMDAHLLSGSRVNATLFPISTKGNSITIRKFAKDPWTIISLIENKTLSYEVASILWSALQYELNVLVGGGTASGKTSFLNAMLVFTPPNQRIISIEDTRELALGDSLHWTPMVTRQPNPEGRGGVEMLDLMVNSLRMRPDRIVLGETRRQREAEVLFEAMHTGHSVYSTVHADTSEQVRKRLISPPIELPESMLSALHLIVVQYRQRRTGARRTFELTEVLPGDDGISLNSLYRWNARSDLLEKVGKLDRVETELNLHTGLNSAEIAVDLLEKQMILKQLSSEGIRDVNSISKIVACYYKRPQEVISLVSKKRLADLLV